MDINAMRRMLNADALQRIVVIVGRQGSLVGRNGIDGCDVSCGLDADFRS